MDQSVHESRSYAGTDNPGSLGGTNARAQFHKGIRLNQQEKGRLRKLGEGLKTLTPALQLNPISTV